MRPEGLTGATGFRTHREVSPVSIREQSPSLQACHPAAQKSFRHPSVHPLSRPRPEHQLLGPHPGRERSGCSKVSGDGPWCDAPESYPRGPGAGRPSERPLAAAPAAHGQPSPEEREKA